MFPRNDGIIYFLAMTGFFPPRHCEEGRRSNLKKNDIRHEIAAVILFPRKDRLIHSLTPGVLPRIVFNNIQGAQ